MTALGVVVVLHRPTAGDLDHLAELRTECKDLLAVDNSPTPEADVRDRLAIEGIDYVFNGNRGGIAGAHNRGLAHLFDRGLDAVVLFDQDSRIGADFFDVMARSCAELGAQPFAIAPRIFDVNDDRYLPELLFRGRFRVRKLALAPDMPLQPCSLLIASGLGISREAYELLGGFAEELFIDQVDTEYCLRAMAAGVQFYVQPQLTLPHSIGTKRWHRVGPLRFVSLNHPEERRYYQARNGVAIARRYFRRFPFAGFAPNIFTSWNLFQVTLLEPRKRTKLACMAWGIVDGFAGRLGPFDEVRPELAARVAAAQEDAVRRSTRAG